MKKSNFEHLKLENQICHRLYVASNAITRLYRPLLEKLDLSYPQYVVMMALWEKDEITMGELARYTLIDKGFLTTLIKKLAEKSILKVNDDKEDKRKRILKLTKRGWSLREKASTIPNELICRYELSPDFDFIKLMSLLDEIIAGCTDTTCSEK